MMLLAFLTTVMLTGVGLMLRAFVYWLCDWPLCDPDPFQIGSVLKISNGVAAGVIIVGIIGLLNAHSEHAILVHASLAGLSVVAFQFQLAGRACAVTMALLTAYSALYPLQVIHMARVAAAGAPHCIYLNQRHRIADGPGDLTFMTFDKGDWTAHAILIVGEGDNRRYGNWSYRKGQFMLPWDLWTEQPDLHCH
ncbi:hypothetical protein [Yoonia sp. SS1-5]|uniref:Uncharacterized protein n=1 Tax=Yoonia rhodophyticola TaxID=3137370 RepID=A0AAN0NK22_9RHOB